MTNGGDKDVTTRKTERALVDKPDTTISPPGLHDEINTKEKGIYETSRELNIYFNTFTKQSCLSELSAPAPIRHVSTWCFRGLAVSRSVTFSNPLAAFVAVAGKRLCLSSELNLKSRSLI